MPETGIKGVVLAAGFGTRLRPLTEKYPKPLVPFAGTSPLRLALWRLKRAGVDQVAVNAHHLAGQVAEICRQNPFSQELELSHETELLGTGGVYGPLRDWQGDSDLLVLNGDIVSDMDLEALVDTHRKTRAFATMAMLPEVIPGENGFFCNRQGEIVAFGKEGPPDAAARNFACAQILSRRFIDTLPPSGAFGIIETGYLPALKRQERLFAYVHKGFWHDLRTPSFYFEALRAYLRLDPASEDVGVSALRRLAGLKTRQLKPDETLDLPFRATGPLLFDDTARIARTANLGPDTILEPKVRIGDDARLERCLVLEGTEIPSGAEVIGRIVGPDLDIPLPSP